MSDDETRGRIEQLLEFVAEDPDDHFSRYALGLEYRSAGRLDDAVAALEEVRRRDPSYAATYYQLALCLMDLAREREALAVAEAGAAVARAGGLLKTVNELDTLAAQIRDAL